MCARPDHTCVMAEWCGGMHLGPHRTTTGARMRTRLLAAVALTVLSADVAAGQSVLGKFTTRNEQGGVITLILQADGPGKVTGSLIGNGATYLVEGQMEDEDVTGTMKNSTGGVYFEA